VRKQYWIVILTQVIYVAVSLVVALVLWGALPHASEASISINQWKFGGAFAGFAFMLVFLHRMGPIKAAIVASERLVSSRVYAAVVYPPTEKQRYKDLFGGFKNCDLYAFNPPFQVEQGGAMVRLEALQVHQRRYKSNVKSHYLFFKQQSNADAGVFFSRLAEMIGRQQLEESVERIHWPNPPEIPCYTFFLGYKDEKSAIILYPAAVMQEGIPQAVMYIEGADELHRILERFFLAQRKEAAKQSGQAAKPHEASKGRSRDGEEID
jgi:hypothetical protein